MSNISGRTDFDSQLAAIMVNLDDYDRSLQDAVMDEMESNAHILTDYAKANHVWQNRTGMAEETLYTFLDDGSTAKLPHLINGAYIVLAHGAKEPRTGVKYGYYLETMRGGKFAILIKTLRAVGEEFYNAIITNLGLGAS